MPPRNRLVRRAPLIDRIKANFDPWDLLLWLSEELNDDAYEEWLRGWATPFGIGLNFLFVLARGASKSGDSRGADDVFGDLDTRRGSGWFAWFATFLVHTLTLVCCANAFYTFFRKRHYRLFEQPIDTAPATPSAQRVRVDSSPLSSSPLRYLQHVISTTTASARAFPDAEREVWEVNIWDPKPFNLTLFTLFSPGHILMYFSLLPPATMDPRPSVTVITALAFGALLSLQLAFLKVSFSQQAKDSALVHGEVMNEYDTKYVRPNLQRPVRDVGIQARVERSTTPKGQKAREVDVYTPTTIINRGFRVNPNPNYANQYDPDNLSNESDRERSASTPNALTLPRSTATQNVRVTPNYVNGYTQSSAYTSAESLSSAGTGGGPADFSSPIKPHHERLRERSPVKGDGGSLGVYSHAASPLRKAGSHGQLRSGREASGAGSPVKRVSMPGGAGLTGAGGVASGSRLFDGTRRRETRYK